MPTKVDGEIITEQAIQYELGRLIQFYSQYLPAEEIRKQMDLLRKKAKDQAVGAKLLINEARRLDLRVSASDIEASLKVMKKNAGGEESFKVMLKKQNMTEDMMKKGIEQGRKVDLLVEKITRGVPEPTEKEMQAHFKEHQSEYRKGDRAQAQHILIKPASGNERDKAVARSKLLEIRARIEEGASFAEQAAAFSDCPSGKKSGGSLGWFSGGMMIPEFDKAVFAMDVGQLSGIIETPLGLHLVKKLDHERGGPAEYGEVADKVRDFLRHAKRGEAISAYVEELRKKAVIVEE